MKKLITLVFVLFIIACGNYVKQPVASHVLAVTLEGDTILVAIDKIRPNQYINYYPIYSRPYYQPYYGNQYNYQFRYPDNRGVSSNIGNRSTPSKSVPVQSSVPDITSRPSPKVLKK